MNVEYSKDFEKSVKKLSGKMLGSIRKVITEVKNAENIKEITDFHCVKKLKPCGSKLSLNYYLCPFIHLLILS